MGNKTNPIGLRLILNSNWDDSAYFKSKDYKKYLHLNYKLRTYLITCCKQYGLVNINIKQRCDNYLILLYIDNIELLTFITTHCINKLANELKKYYWADIEIIVSQLANAEYHPAIIASRLANEMHNNNNNTIKANVKQIAKELIGSGVIGIKASYSGRINGIDIAQTVWHIEGRIPLHTLSADVRYASVSIKTNYGICNVKVWICVNDFTTKNL